MQGVMEHSRRAVAKIQPKQVNLVRLMTALPFRRIVATAPKADLPGRSSDVSFLRFRIRCFLSVGHLAFRECRRGNCDRTLLAYVKTAYTLFVEFSVSFERLAPDVVLPAT